jgi:hypothetical protein
MQFCSPHLGISLHISAPSLTFAVGTKASASPDSVSQLKGHRIRLANPTIYRTPPRTQPRITPSARDSPGLSLGDWGDGDTSEPGSLSPSRSRTRWGRGWVVGTGGGGGGGWESPGGGGGGGWGRLPRVARLAAFDAPLQHRVRTPCRSGASRDASQRDPARYTTSRFATSMSLTSINCDFAERAIHT